KWIVECAKDLEANKGQSLVVAGHRQPLVVHLMAYAMNYALGNIGKTVTLLPAVKKSAPPPKSIYSNATDTLVILGGNPAYHMNWPAKQKPATVVRLGYYEDETFEMSDWNFPATHYLESWGDATTSDGTLVPIQPLIEPLFGGLTELEFLARLAGESKTNPYECVRTTFFSKSIN